MTQPNYALLRHAYAILDGIPQDAINLNTVIANKTQKDHLECGALACGIGWLSLHPKFNAIGLRAKKIRGSWELSYQGRLVNYESAASLVFGITEQQAHKLFGAEFTDLKQHKGILLSRIRSYLRERGQLDSQLRDKQLGKVANGTH